MKFGPIPIDDSPGNILGHNIAGADGRRLFRKGHILTADDLPALRSTGRSVVYVAQLEAGDVDEDSAARRIADAVMGPHLYSSHAATGRVNLKAEALGVLRVDAARLHQLNSQLGITLATLPNHTAVPPSKMVGTVKIIPYAVPETAVTTIEHLAKPDPLLWLDPLPARRVAVILSGSPAAAERIQRSFDPPLRNRLELLGSKLASLTFLPLDDARDEVAMAATIQQQAAAGAELIILAGETAIMDHRDIAPRAVQQAGGELTCFGAPVDPGNLLMLAYLGNLPILGAPGCVRSPKRNIVDEVLPRLLVGDRLTQADIIGLGHGGLLEDVPERPYPRSKL
ncbi:MAG: molybdopterin-binding protein [Ardenticatenaceae bacterium]|nr:molybdopterin-binding protein [Anaerolineales bacterium]MCB8939697.1 molybdopterin-binding protein [Ardenticatenaceae bacterium]MCB8975219.1 molybdopterin-binding protein [Ardenticatenaceae bacterium]